MEEQKLVPIKANVTDKEGNELYNLNLKTKVMPDGSVSQGLMAGNYFIVEKLFSGGFKSKFGYSIKALYDDKRCSFFLSDNDYAEFEPCGGIGDKVKLTGELYSYTFKDKSGKEITKDAIRYSSSLVQ